MKNEYDVVILGAGAGAIGAAYALKESGLSILVVEKNPLIGGTHLNAWVNVHAATPAPPFLKKIIDDMVHDGTACYIDNEYHLLPIDSKIDYYPLSFLRKEFTGWRETVNICFNIESMMKRYVRDLSNSISFMLNTTFMKIARYENGVVEEVEVCNNVSNEVQKIKAKAFIDCTGNNVLIQSLGKDAGGCLSGIDAQQRYLDRYGFVEPHNLNTVNWPYVNDPTLIYKVVPGKEDLSQIKSYGPNDALVYQDSVDSCLFVNSINYLGEMGMDVCDSSKGEDYVYQRLKEKNIGHWKTIKNGASPRLRLLNLESMKFVNSAPVLGVRETYRTLCERMLHENDLYNLVLNQEVRERGGLDTIIAIGNHIADIHSNAARSNIDVKYITSEIKPYGVSYGSLVPLKLKNVLVASRGAGFTHLAASSFRLNKDIMQLGWAAGKAAMIKINSSVSDFRNVDFRQLKDNIMIQETINIVKSVFMYE